MDLKTRTININRQLLFAGILFTLHNIEESIGFACFSYPDHLPFPIRPTDSKSMILSIILITAIAWGVILWSIPQNKKSTKRDILNVLIVVFLINAIFPHISGALLFQKYFPALISSVLLYLPYSIWMLPKIRRMYPTLKYYISTLLIGLIISILLVLLAQGISSLFI